MIKPIRPRNKPPKNHPATLLFLYPAIIGHAIMLMTVLIIPKTVNTGEISIFVPPIRKGYGT